MVKSATALDVIMLFFFFFFNLLVIINKEFKNSFQESGFLFFFLFSLHCYVLM